MNGNLKAVQPGEVRRGTPRLFRGPMLVLWTALAVGGILLGAWLVLGL